MLRITSEQKFHRLTPIEDVGVDAARNRLWRCQCDCGNETILRASALRRGEVCSCGCLRNEVAVEQGKKRRRHGHRYGANGKQTRAYTAWANMKLRCTNPNLRQYKDWGGRGITYDPNWEIFDNFLADMGEPPKGLTLDRADNDGDYSKENCRWTDRATQRRNARNVYRLVEDGEMLTLKDYANKHSLNVGNIYCRLHRGMSLENAIRLA